MKVSETRDLLSDYMYPAPVLNCIEGVTSWLKSHLPVSRLLLLGSTARGELSWYGHNAEVDVFSDLEFYMLTKRRLRTDEIHALSMAKADWHHTWSFPNPFFHIDVSQNPEVVFWRKIRFDSRIATFELLTNAKVLSGPDFDREPWLFGIDRLDLGNTNELVLVRLWMQLLFTPIRVVKGTACDYEWLVFKFALCRNILEVLTIFLPNMGVLLPSYRQREEYFRAHSELHGYFPPETIEVQSACLEAKLHLRMPRSWTFYYEQFLQQYLCLLAHLTGVSINGESPSWEHVDGLCHQVMSNRGRFMNDHWLPKMRRLRRELRLFRRYTLLAGLPVALKWLRSPRRPLLICFLLYMHWALYEILQAGRSEALPRAADLLVRIHPLFSGQMVPGSAAEQWLYLRRVFIDFMSWWMYNDINHLKEWGVTEWAYERG